MVHAVAVDLHFLMRRGSRGTAQSGTQARGEDGMEQPRRTVLAAPGDTAASMVSGASAGWKPAQRYPDPAVEILDPSFAKYRLAFTSVERLGTSVY